MTRLAEIAATTARVVALMRDRPDDREAQKSAFRAMLARLADGELWIGANTRHLYIGGQPIHAEAGDLQALRDQLLGHGIGELKTPKGLPPASLLLVLRTLASPHGTFPRLQQLADFFGGHGLPPIRLAPPVPVVLPDATQARPSAPAPAVPARPRAPAKGGDLSALGPGAASEEQVGLLHFVSVEPTVSASGFDELVAELERDPAAALAADRLNDLVTYADLAAQKEHWDDVLRAAAVLVRLEDGAADDDTRRAFSIGLRRVIGSRGSLDQIAQMTVPVDTRDQAVAVLQRVGADATEVLLRRLVSASEVGERRGYFNALSQMTQGTELLSHMLDHDEWFVVRNVAELCGEMRLESAVPALVRQGRNSNDKVRRAVIGALARIGSPATHEALARALHDPVPLVRLQAVSGLDGRHEALLPALLEAVQSEEHADVQAEVLRALGRIGSPQALAALKQASEPGKGLFRKKPTAMRVAAVEGLRLSGMMDARKILEELAEDKDKDVRRAAERAMKAMPPGE